jgi:hypothetical protein
MRYYWIALSLLSGLVASAQQSTLTLARVAGTNVIQLNPSSGDVSLIIGTNKPAGTCYQLAPGVYPCWYYMDVPTNGWISGSGWNTVLVNYVSNSTAASPVSLIHPTDNSVVENLMITNAYLGTGPDIYQSCWGVHPNQPNSSACTNAVIRGCKLIGGSDAIYFRNNSACTGSVYSCVITSRWDANVFFDSAHKFEYYDCIIASGATRVGVGIAEQNASTAYIAAHNCSFYGLHAGGASYNVFLADSTETFHAYNCFFTNYSSPFIESQSGGPVELINCNLVRSQTDDGGSGGTTIFPFGEGTNFLSSSVGTVYTMTASYALMTFGTTSPSVTINNAGTYLVYGRANLTSRGATYAATNTYSVKIRRTNNGAADLAGSEAVQTIPIITTTTEDLGVIDSRPVTYTASATDILQLWGTLSATPSAGNVICDRADIIAIRLY